MTGIQHRWSGIGLLGLGLAVGCMHGLGTVRPVRADVVLVKNGVSRALIVTADEPGPVAAYAAKELALHVSRATGVTLDVVTEAQAPMNTPLSRIYVGVTEAAARQGIEAAALPADAYLLRTVDRDLYIVGLEAVDDETVFGRSARRGTLYGVYEVLERYVGVRWLWPGDLGTFVAPAKTLVIREALDESAEPVFRFRNYRTGRLDSARRSYDADIARLAFSPEGLESYASALHTYLVRHRIGNTEPKPPVGHYFSGWWKRHGEKHPDWFMMREDGGRGPRPGASEWEQEHVAMCVSNPDLHRYIVEEVWDGGDIIRLGEVDVRVFCQCPVCQSWDLPAEQPEFARYTPLVSDRHARFWKAVRDLAAPRNPKVRVTTFLYWNYLPAPVTDIRLDGVYGEFVPWGNSAITYYPMDEVAHEWVKAQWMGWSERGVDMGYRPNYLLGGYVMPHLSTWQVGDMFQFAARNGMVGFDFDSLWSHWAVKGPMYYIHMRLSVNPEQDIGGLRREYFAAFGPAAGRVEAYFDGWEEYSRTRAPRGGVGWSDPTRANDLYPPECFVQPAEMLEQALALAQRDPRPEFAERVRFLQAGLEHARLSARFIGTLGHRGRIPSTDPVRFLAAREAIEELIRFRRDHEHLYIADFVAASGVENRRINIGALLDADMKTIEAQARANWIEEPWGAWYFRKDEHDAGLREQWYVPEAGDAAKGLRFDEGQAPEFRIDDSVWTSIRVPARLGETPIGPYLGYGWYATVFTVPESWQGQTVRLRFDAVDEQAWVYINGVKVGEHTVESEGLPVGVLWERPFSLEVPPGVIRLGRENLLVVRTHASVGASGIWGPVGVYHLDDLH